MIVARGLGRGDAQMVVTGSLGGLGRRVAAPVSGGGSGGKRKPGWARGDVSALLRQQQLDDDDVLLIVIAGAVQAGLLE